MPNSKIFIIIYSNTLTCPSVASVQKGEFKNNFGSKNVDFLAVVYATEEAKKKAEPKKKEKKAAPGEQK